MSDDLLRLPATELRRQIGAGELSPVELVQASLDRAEALSSTINALVTPSPTALDEAKAAAEAVASGAELGPLHGLPVGIKDVTDVGGLRSTYGCALYADRVAPEDALVVRRLREAGAIILGKTNTPEFATGGNTFNPVFGRTRNPWNTERSAGGSTGGGAAGLATGMFALAEGTDLGGSLRIPASFNGVVGMRPTPGLVPTWPSPLLWDIYQVTGGMARTAGDLALMLQAVHGPDPISPVYQPYRDRDFVGAVEAGLPPGSKIAYCPDFCDIGVDPKVEAVCRDAAFALRDAGATVEEIELDLSPGREAFLAIRGLWMVVQQYERLDQVDELGENLAGNIRRGLGVTTRELAAAEHARAAIWQQMRQLFCRYDFLLAPCMAVPPFPVEENYPATIAGREMETYIDWVAPTFVLSLTNLPVGSAPCGLDPEGLPAALQVVGKPCGEEAVLACVDAITKARPTGLPELTL